VASNRSSLAPVVALALTLVPAGPLSAAPQSAPAPAALPETPTRVIEARRISAMDQLLDAIADRRVVFVGESHDRPEDHLTQLKVIQGLKARGKDVAIGMESFQQPYQPALDAYIRGDLDEAGLLRQTQYFDRWGFDWRLYRPLLQYAREQHIPVIALNLEAELTHRVREVGLEGLSPTERARLPAQIDRSDTAYQERVRAVFEQHPMPDKRSFERFIEVQLAWDEGMAERAARYLRENPQKTLVVLAGVGHIEYGQGIPRRLLRRVPVPAATLVNASQRELDPAIADYLVFPQPVELPPPGLLGVMLKPAGEQRLAEIQGFSPDSGAQAAGLKEGDRIVRLAGQPVAAYEDIRIALLDRRPGERVPVEVLRKPLVGQEERLTVEVELH
jgi:uncharacterized iron-regulated protein